MSSSPQNRRDEAFVYTRTQYINKYRAKNRRWRYPGHARILYYRAALAAEMRAQPVHGQFSARPDKKDRSSEFPGNHHHHRRRGDGNTGQRVLFFFSLVLRGRKREDWYMCVCVCIGEGR